MKERPLVSVIMPVFNTEKYVAEAIRSVLEQTHSNTELICIDDGSKDGSLDVIRSFGEQVEVVESGENRGIGSARNRGLVRATGDLIAFIDADDIWEKGKLEKQVAALERDPGLAVCFTYVQCFLSPELPEEVRRARHCPAEPGPGYLAGTMLLRRTVVDRVGLFDETLRMGEFIDWNTRIEDAGFRNVMLEEVLYLRRIHATNTGVSERPSRLDYLKVARNVLARRKQS